jgi:ATP-binding protein involved in chromosome partitioning
MVSEQLSAQLGAEVPLLGRVPFDVRLREGSDAGMPLVLSAPESPAAAALISMARELGGRPRGLAGLSLGITPAGRS